MATFMDVSLFSYFGPIFLFLMVFVIVYAFLTVSKIFDKVDGKNGLYAIIALGTAFFILMFKPAMTVIAVMIPWFTVLIILIFLILFVLKMFNQDDELGKAIIGQKAVYWTFLTIVIIIVVSSLSTTFGQSLLTKQVGDTETMPVDDAIITAASNTTISTGTATTATPSFGDNVLMTLVNPKVLGLILMMLIGLFTIILMADSQSAKF